MTPRRRLVIVIAAVMASFAGTTAAFASVDGGVGPTDSAEERDSRYGDWVCVGIETVDFGYCQGNPLPERLPLPEDRPRL